MSNILSALGFRRERGKALCDSLLEIVKEASAVVPCGRGEYLIARNGSIELWFHNSDAELRKQTGRLSLVGLTPFHAGQGMAEVSVTSAWSDMGGEPLDGALSARIEGGRPGAAPFMFESLGYAFATRETLPYGAKGQLIGLAYGLQVRGGSGGLAMPRPLVRPSIEPMDVASAQDPGDLVPAGSQSRSLITGRVLKRQPLGNPWTGRLYWWMLVETDQATIDVFSDPEVHAGEIASGSFIAADCWLIGKLEPPAAMALQNAVPLPGSLATHRESEHVLQTRPDRRGVRRD